MCCRRRKKGEEAEPDDHALGRSRGGFSTKLHLLCDRNGHPLHFVLTAGQDHESQSLIDLLEGALVTGIDDPTIVRPVRLAGDKGYRADWIDLYLTEQAIEPVIPSKSNEGGNARAVAFDPGAYRERNIIERLVGWLKECRRILTRFEKTATNFAGMIKMAFVNRYLRLMCP